MFKRHSQYLGQILGVAGTRVLTKLERPVYHRQFRIRASVTIQIAVAAVTNIRNQGSAFAIWDFIGITGGGDADQMVLDGPTLRHIAEVFSLSGLSATRLTNTAVATYNLVEEAFLYASFPGDADPHCYAYKPSNPNKDLYFFAQLRADGGSGGLVTAGGATVTITNPVLQVEEVFDEATAGAPDFIPLIRQDTIKIAVNGAQAPYYFNTPNAIRLVVLKESTDQGIVGDILVDLSVRSKNRIYWGPGQIPIDDIQRGMESEAGGAVYAAGQGPSATGAAIGGFTFFNFMENGRAANQVDGTEAGLRIQMTANQSAQANVTQSNVVVTFVEGVRDARTKPKLAYSI